MAGAQLYPQEHTSCTGEKRFLIELTLAIHTTISKSLHESDVFKKKSKNLENPARTVVHGLPANSARAYC